MNASVSLEQLPAYAPELNPIEYLLGYIKGNDLANVCAKDLVKLNAAARKAILRTRYDKLAKTFAAALHLVAAFLILRNS